MPHFPKPNPKYRNTTKFFNKTDVRDLAYRKAATIGGIEETGNVEALLRKGKELLGPALIAAAESKAPAEA